MNKLLKIDNLAVKLQSKAILSDVELSLNKGEILGLVGPSGCGKTTLLNTLAGFIEQSKGEIYIHSEDHSPLIISQENMLPAEQRNIGMIFQDYALFPHLSVTGNICFGIAKLEKSEQQYRCKELLNLLELTEFADCYPHQLSGGQQQRVAIARALAPQPNLLLLDEPFSNIDARLRNELMIEIRQLLKRLNMTAIFVTHNKDEVFTFADKIAVMHQGHVLQVGSPALVCQQPDSWQVADFLQLGSWLPVQAVIIENELRLKSAIGLLATDTISNAAELLENQARKSNAEYQLLVKPNDITLDASQVNNVAIANISVTEQGYHYLLKSIEQSSKLSFTQLSFYSQELFSLGVELSIELKGRQLLLYPAD